MKNKYFYLILLLFTVLVGCKTQKQTRETLNETVAEEIVPKVDTVKLIKLL